MNSEAALRKALTTFESEATQHVVKAQEMWQIAGWMRMLSGLRPHGIEAVRLVIKDGGVWTARTMLEELKRRDWEPKTSTDPLRAIAATMSRMCREKEIERIWRGHYRYIGLHRYIGPWAAPTP